MKSISIALRKSHWLIACAFMILFVSLAHAGLSFEDRVIYQTRIEQIYWNHTVWPSESITG